MQLLSLIGLQALYHSFIIGTCDFVDKNSFNRTDLKDTASMHLTTVAAWGDKSITTAWKDILVLTWRHLSVGYDATDKDIACMKIESSERQCEDAQHRELQPPVTIEPGEVEQRADEKDADDAVMVDPTGLTEDVQVPPANRSFSFGDDLVRDLKSCLVPFDDDLSSRQVLKLHRSLLQPVADVIITRL